MWSLTRITFSCMSMIMFKYFDSKVSGCVSLLSFRFLFLMKELQYLKFINSSEE